MAVVWCHHWHRHWVAVDIAIAAIILPAATACNCIAHCATALAAPLCIVRWHFPPCKGMLWHCSSSCGIVLCSAALCVMPQPCSSCHSLVLHTAALRFIPQCLASCHGVMLCAAASCIMLGILLRATNIALHAVALAMALRIEQQCRASNLCAVYFFH